MNKKNQFCMEPDIEWNDYDIVLDDRNVSKVSFVACGVCFACRIKLDPPADVNYFCPKHAHCVQCGNKYIILVDMYGDGWPYSICPKCGD